MSGEVPRVVPSDELESGPLTPGMERSQAFASETVWVGDVRAAPGSASGWHHHGEHTTFARVLEGRVRLEFGPGGSEAIEAGAGDFVTVPPHIVHRESNPGPDEGVLVLVRTGTGPSVFNVEGPE